MNLNESCLLKISEYQSLIAGTNSGHLLIWNLVDADLALQKFNSQFIQEDESWKESDNMEEEVQE